MQTSVMIQNRSESDRLQVVGATEQYSVPPGSEVTMTESFTLSGGADHPVFIDNLSSSAEAVVVTVDGESVQVDPTLDLQLVLNGTAVVTIG